MALPDHLTTLLVVVVYTVAVAALAFYSGEEHGYSAGFRDGATEDDQ